MVHSRPWIFDFEVYFREKKIIDEAWFLYDYIGTEDLYLMIILNDKLLFSKLYFSFIFLHATEIFKLKYLYCDEECN